MNGRRFPVRNFEVREFKLCCGVRGGGGCGWGWPEPGVENGVGYFPPPFNEDVPRFKRAQFRTLPKTQPQIK